MKAVLLCLLLAGCASGVHMTDEEARACRDAPTGCAVFTEQELTVLVQRVGKVGYAQGWRDAIKQSGRNM